MTPDKLKKNFSRCPDWEEKYLYLIELGDRFATLDEAFHTDAYLVPGCQSQVWVTLSVNDGKVALNASSDAAIVRGLLALLVIAFDGQPLADAKSFDLKGWFAELDLESHLTPTRTMGLNAIVNHVKALTEQHN